MARQSLFFILFSITNNNLWLLFFLCIPSMVNSQEIVLEKNLSKSVLFQKSGINHNHFGYVVSNYSLYLLKKNDDLHVIPAKSHTFSAGYRWNHRVYRIFSMGFTGSYLYEVFALKQETGKIFPNSILHQREKVQKHSMATEIYSRVTLKKEYDQLGVYLDIGAYGSLSLATRHKMHDKNNDPAYLGSTRDVTLKKLDYIEPFNYGVLFRLGRNRFSFFTGIRMSRWLKNSYDFAQPPKTSLGLDISLY
jgi:hypothetical protein